MITCVGLIPAEEAVNPTAGLNILVMAINKSEQESCAAVSVFGCVNRKTRLLVQKDCTLHPKEHAHLYFFLPAECFSEPFWGEECGEVILYAGVDRPQTTGKLVFVD